MSEELSNGAAISLRYAGERLRIAQELAGNLRSKGEVMDKRYWWLFDAALFVGWSSMLLIAVVVLGRMLNG
ncbi:hypothetical protein [Sphingomonas sp. BAUL-RG-20F-R05-02]|jgi:hypothetical protein|uniref:hypothetical protein n=1 Tax=Sphingomonas sp. BAUL-RG-20F-R05-02 TaxID=2914830 RepID=UPI001F57EEE7|nr:hypothetical protein [Sphingomonas sp. BAUL-RG-20F-R05-02]